MSGTPETPRKIPHKSSPGTRTVQTEEPKNVHTSTQRLTVTLETLVVPVEPRGPGTSSLDAIGAVSALAKAAGLASGAREASALPVLVHRICDPVDPGVVADLHVGGIDEDDLVVLHGGVLVDPVRVEHAEVGVLPADLLLGDGLEIPLEFDVVDTLVLRLTENHAAVVGALPPSTAHATPHNDVSLLGLVSESMGLVGTSGTMDAGDLGALAVLPCANSEEEAEGVTLLVTPQLLHVFVATHVCADILNTERCN